MAFELQPPPCMSWTWRRRKTPWQRHLDRLDRLLDVVIAVLAVVFLAELFLLLK
jgi:hypothetical protein